MENVGASFDDEDESPAENDAVLGWKKEGGVPLLVPDSAERVAVPIVVVFAAAAAADAVAVVLVLMGTGCWAVQTRLGNREAAPLVMMVLAVELDNMVDEDMLPSVGYP
jgi:hypothetical protein